MPLVLRLVRELTAPPGARAIDGVLVESFGGIDDIDGWLEVRNAAMAAQTAAARPWKQSDFEREFLEKPWWRPEHLWIARAATGASATRQPARPAGIVSLELRPTAEPVRGVIHWLAVHPAFQRCGIGRLLLATLEQACWDAGVRRVQAETLALWRPAVSFYRQAGYIEARREL